MTSLPELTAIDSPVQPWVSSPYSLLTWWDMERFSAAAFQQIVSGLTFIFGKIEELPSDLEAGDLAVKYIPIVEKIREDCEKIGLKTSVACATDFIGLADLMNARDLTGSLRELDNTIRREMQGCVFFHMPSERVPFYAERHLFGSDRCRQVSGDAVRHRGGRELLRDGPQYGVCFSSDAGDGNWRPGIWGSAGEFRWLGRRTGRRFSI